MFVRLLRIDYRTEHEEAPATPCPLRWIDNFAMRNFTNDAIFDDTLPVADGLMEAGHRVPLPLLADRMTDWFRRKGYLSASQAVTVREDESSDRSS